MAKGPGGIISGGFQPLKAPDAPTIDSVSAGVLTANVTFSAPADTGAGSVDSYVITARQSDGSGVSGTASAAGTVSLTLTAGGITTFAAQAISNAFGPGAFSGFGNSTPVFSGQELYAWGNNGEGELGQSDKVSRSSPTQIGALTTWSSGDAGPADRTQMAAISTSGELYAWGHNYFGQTGHGDRVFRSSPTQVGALTNWSQVSCGDEFTVAVKTDGTVWSWGQASDGRLGHNANPANDVSSPIQIGALTNWSEVSSGTNHCLAIKTDGTLWAWGDRGSGKLGDNSESSSVSSPTQIGSETNWTRVVAVKNTSFAKTTTGEWYVWGANSTGVYGNNTEGAATQASSPVQLAAADVDWLEGGESNFIIAVKTDGSLFAWGDANLGKLGNNTQTPNKSSPIQIGSLTNWAKSGCGRQHALCTKTDGTLWSWGDNANGQLGQNNRTYRSSPVQVGAETTWLEARGGHEVTLAFVGTT